MKMHCCVGVDLRTLFYYKNKAFSNLIRGSSYSLAFTISLSAHLTTYPPVPHPREYTSILPSPW